MSQLGKGSDKIRKRSHGNRLFKTQFNFNAVSSEAMIK